MKKIVSIFLATSIFSTCTFTLTNVKNIFAKELLEQKPSVKSNEINDNDSKNSTENKNVFSPFLVAQASNKKTIVFELNGGTAEFDASVEFNTTEDKTVADALKAIVGADKSIIPTKTVDGVTFVFDGWFKDEELTQGFDMNTVKVNGGDLPENLYAKWTKVSTLLAQFKTLIHDMMRMDKTDYTTETLTPLFAKGDAIKELVEKIKTDKDNWNDTTDVQTHGDELIKVVYPVQSLYNSLKAAKDYLPELKTAIDEAETLKTTLKAEDFTAQSYKNFTDALEKAKGVQTQNNKDLVLSIKDAIKLLKDTTKELSRNVVGTVTTESGHKVTLQAYPEFSQEYKDLKAVFDKEMKDNSSVLVSQLADKYDVSKLEVMSLVNINVENQNVNGENVTLSLAALTDGKNYFLAHIDDTTKKIDEVYEGKNNGDGTFTFSGVKRFSPFAVLTAQPKNTTGGTTNTDENNNATTPNTNQNSNPATGDTQSVMLFVVLSLVGAGGIYTIYMMRKKDDENEIELS